PCTEQFRNKETPTSAHGNETNDTARLGSQVAGTWGRRSRRKEHRRKRTGNGGISMINYLRSGVAKAHGFCRPYIILCLLPRAAWMDVVFSVRAKLRRGVARLHEMV